ncbi:hypothetical protein [Streptomyces sp. RLB3-6]|uniref:hypothetical protein n=1 Tax=Streptomyces sp. RLB3-6 TaxID=2594457 RepID=UPI0011633B56|nr:hypothetical protein [Streptomyces sp. RLB3-6]QDN84369.1 hypothetical protein FNV61_00125 [Streptomyces sp. RLB3-6]
MSDTTALDAAKSAIRRNTAGGRHLYAPSVLEEATRLAAKFYAAGKEHQIEAGDWDNVTSFASAALDALASKYGSRVRLSREELRKVSGALLTALADKGLTARPGRRTAIDPLPGGPRWGLAQTGLAVGIHLDGGWDLTVDQPTSSVRSITAPPTEDGAREVADIVHAILRGDAPDPFARRF